MKKVLDNSNRKIKNKTEKKIPFAVTIYPRLKILQKIIDKKLYVLYINEEDEKAFTPNKPYGFI